MKGMFISAVLAAAGVTMAAPADLASILDGIDFHHLDPETVETVLGLVNFQVPDLESLPQPAQDILTESYSDFDSVIGIAMRALADRCYNDNDCGDADKDACLHSGIAAYEDIKAENEGVEDIDELAAYEYALEQMEGDQCFDVERLRGEVDELESLVGGLSDDQVDGFLKGL